VYGAIIYIIYQVEAVPASVNSDARSRRHPNSITYFCEVAGSLSPNHTMVYRRILTGNLKCEMAQTPVA